MSNIRWITFDLMEIFLIHSKPDQLGDNAKYLLHLFANPDDPVLCPALASSMYFGFCFHTLQSRESPLLPGYIQYVHFCNLLEQILHDHEEGLSELGYKKETLELKAFLRGQ